MSADELHTLECTFCGEAATMEVTSMEYALWWDAHRRGACASPGERLGKLLDESAMYAIRQIDVENKALRAALLHVSILAMRNADPGEAVRQVIEHVGVTLATGGAS